MKYQGIIDRARSPFCDDVDLDNAIECLVSQEKKKAEIEEHKRIEKFIASKTLTELQTIWDNCKKRFK